MSTTRIAVERLSKSFGQTRVLNEIGFQIESGPRVALIGPSGSGSSPLLRHLVGLPSANRHIGSRVQLMGRDIQRGGELQRGSRAQRCRCGYIFQQFNLVGRLSVLTNVL